MSLEEIPGIKQIIRRRYDIQLILMPDTRVKPTVTYVKQAGINVEDFYEEKLKGGERMLTIITEY